MWARRRRDLIANNGARLFVLFVVLAGWHLVAARYDATLLPGPLQTYAGLVRGWALITAGALNSLLEMGLGFGLGVLTGLALGSIIGVSKTIQGVLHPFLVLYQAIPKTGLAPMIVLLLGFGILPKIALAAMTALFPVLEASRKTASPSLQLDTPIVFGALLTLTVIGLACYFLVCLIEKLILRWFNLEASAS